MNIVQYNIAKIRYPITDIRMKEFSDNINLVHKIADRIGGLIYRVQDESGTAMNMSDDPTILPNLTVWKDIDSLMKFVHKTVHKMFMNRREEWFLPMEGPKNVLWFGADSYRPLMFEGKLHLQYYKENGNSPYAFDWKYLQ
jgi:hypothetical protein